MKKNNDNKKIKTEKQNFFSLSLFVNLESCCIAWKANTTETKCEGAVRRWEEEENTKDSDEKKKDKARDVEKKKKQNRSSAVGQGAVQAGSWRTWRWSEQVGWWSRVRTTDNRVFTGRSLRTEPWRRTCSRVPQARRRAQCTAPFGLCSNQPGLGATPGAARQRGCSSVGEGGGQTGFSGGAPKEAWSRGNSGVLS